MCVMSMVIDHYEPIIPRPQDFPWIVPNPGTTNPIPAGVTITTTGGFPAEPSIAKEISELRQLLAEFRQAVAAAKTVDRLTAQPDCVDPEKAKLEDRVEELEKRLEAFLKSKHKAKRRSRK